MRNLAENLFALALFLGFFAWLTYGAWLLSGGSLFLTMALITAAMVAMAVALDWLIPDRREKRPTPQPPEAADPLEIPDTNPETEPDWSRADRDWPESIEVPESWKPAAPIEAQEAQEVERTRKAAEQGDTNAQIDLAVMYDPFLDNTGEGVLNDDTKAVRWYCKAAEQGHSFAQLQLGQKYEQGVGVLQDFVQAYAWMSRASLGGQHQAYRDSLQERMAPEQVAEGQKLAAELQAHIEASKSK